jgi:hypothetical protein
VVQSSVDSRVLTSEWIMLGVYIIGVEKSTLRPFDQFEFMRFGQGVAGKGYSGV